MAPSTPSSRPHLPLAIRAALLQRHPSTEPFLRALLLGWAASSLPAALRAVLLDYGQRRSFSTAARQLALALLKGLRPRGFGVAFAAAVGGARWLQDLVESVVRRAYFAAVGRIRRTGKGKERETAASLQAEQQRAVQDERNVLLLSTFLAATLSSITGLFILQSSPSIRRPISPPTNDELDLVLTPYAPALPVTEVSPTPLVQVAPSRLQPSPTIDLTLFLLIRAADILVRGIQERASPLRGRSASFIRTILDNSDALLFSASAFQIMFAWFYKPHLLPPSYSKWILQLARMDPRLLQLLRYAREGRFIYGEDSNDKEVAVTCRQIAQHAGKNFDSVNPAHISRLDCSFVHGTLGAGSCEANAAKRWARAFLDALMIYLPVHVIPPLLLNFQRVLQHPELSILRILLAASRSSAFLATFVASVYAGVCLTRTRLPQVVPSIPQQSLDSGLCVLVGCFACGASIFIENKRRRREMALYCAPRALYILLDQHVPQKLTQGKAGKLFCKWVERIVFVASSGTIITAAVHRPDLVSGLVSGVTSFAVRGWHRPSTTKALV